MNPNALYLIGHLYYNGNGVEQNYLLAFKFISKAIEQNITDQFNISDAYNTIGVMYLNGLGIEQDIKIGLTYFYRAAKQNNACALLNIARIFINDKQYKTALEYLNRAADQNITEAQYLIAYMYMQGLGVKKNYNITFHYLNKIIVHNKIDEPDYQRLKIKALLDLGYLYHNALGVKQNNKMAFELYVKASILGSKDAQYNIGVFYENGIGMEQDNQLALEYYTKAYDENKPNIKKKIKRLKKLLGLKD